jgi:hypothetical protein
MRRIFLGFFILITATQALAFELIMIQAVSESRRSFVTRNGKRAGNIIGVSATFTAEDISILARAINVTGNFTQWELINKEATLPFEKGAIVTFYPATEYLWALAPESERKKYIKSQIPQLRRSWVFKGAITRRLSESVSDAPAAESERGGFLGEVFYESDLIQGLAYDVGLRYEREVVNYPAATFLTRRSMLIADLIYYTDHLKDYIKGRIYLSLGAGYGLSNTQTVGLSQSGVVGLLPVIKLGVSLPFNETWEFLSDGAFESLQTREEQKGGKIQTTTQTNFKLSMGLRKFF